MDTALALPVVGLGRPDLDKDAVVVAHDAQHLPPRLLCRRIGDLSTHDDAVESFLQGLGYERDLDGRGLIRKPVAPDRTPVDYRRRLGGEGQGHSPRVHLRAALRVFRLDRISTIEPRDAAFLPPVDIDCAEYVHRNIAALGRWLFEVVLHVTLDDARRRAARVHADLEPHSTGSTVMRGRADDLDVLTRFLVSLDCAFKVREPMELRGGPCDG